MPEGCVYQRIHDWKKKLNLNDAVSALREPRKHEEQQQTEQHLVWVQFFLLHFSEAIQELWASVKVSWSALTSAVFSDMNAHLTSGCCGGWMKTWDTDGHWRNDRHQTSATHMHFSCCFTAAPHQRLFTCRHVNNIH